MSFSDPMKLPNFDIPGFDIVEATFWQIWSQFWHNIIKVFTLRRTLHFGPYESFAKAMNLSLLLCLLERCLLLLISSCSTFDWVIFCSKRLRKKSLSHHLLLLLLDHLVLLKMLLLLVNLLFVVVHVNWLLLLVLIIIIATAYVLLDSLSDIFGQVTIFVVTVSLWTPIVRKVKISGLDVISRSASHRSCALSSHLICNYYLSTI